MPSVSISEWLKGLLDDKVDREDHTSFDSAIRALAYEAGEHNQEIQTTSARSSAGIQPTDPFDTLGQVVGRFGGIGSKKSLKQKMDIHRLMGLYPDLTTIAISPIGVFDSFKEFGGVTELDISDSAVNPLTVTQPADPLRSNKEHMETAVSQVESLLQLFLVDGAEAGGEKAQIKTLQRALFQVYELRGCMEEEASPQGEQPTLADLHGTLSRLADDPEEPEAVRDAASSLVKTLDELEDGDVYGLLNESGRLAIEENEINLVQLSEVTGSDHAKVVASAAVLNAIREAKTISGPVLIVLDEAHYYFSGSPFQEVLHQEFRHGRHHDIAYDYNTQRFADTYGQGMEILNHNTDIVEVYPPYENVEVSETEGLNLSLSEDHQEFLMMPPGKAPVEYLQRTQDAGWNVCAYNPQGREEELLQKHNS